MRNGQGAHFSFFLREITTESPIDSTRVPKMMMSDQRVGISMWGMFRFRPTRLPSWLMYSFMASNILIPTKMRMMPRPYFR